MQRGYPNPNGYGMHPMNFNPMFSGPGLPRGAPGGFGMPRPGPPGPGFPPMYMHQAPQKSYNNNKVHPSRNFPGNQQPPETKETNKPAQVTKLPSPKNMGNTDVTSF